MLTLIIVGCCSLVVSFVLTPFFRDLFGFLQITDKPDSDRKIHLRPVPRVGGIPLAASFLVAVAVLLVVGWRWTGLFNWHDPSVQLTFRLLPAVALIFIMGLVDDFRGLTPWQKIAGQFLAAGYAYWVGVRLAIPTGFPGPALLVDVVSILWLVFCANAINLIDGIDGLATGVALLASISLLMAAVIHHDPGLALVIAPFIGGLIGFLYYNFNPASVFLGDSGSLLVGFLLGCYGLMWNQHASTGLGMTAPLIALAFPIMDVMLSIIRRFLRRRPIFGADRNHIHHKLLSLGLSQRNVALLLYGVSAVAASLAVLQTILRPHLATVFLLLFVAIAYLGFRWLRYTEFGVLGQFLFAGDFRRALQTNIHLKEYQQSVTAARTLDECWLALRNMCCEAEFDYVALQVEGKFFEDTLRKSPNNVASPSNLAWRLQIPLSLTDFAIFGHDPSLPGPAMLIAPFAKVLQAKLAENDWQFRPSRESKLSEKLKAHAAAVN